MSSTLSKIDNLPIRGSYKLKLYEIYATPRLRFPLTVHDLTTRGLEKMDVLVKQFVKKLLKIPRTANIDMLQHSKERSLRLPSFLYDYGHIISESNPSDSMITAALAERNEHHSNLRTRHTASLETKDPKKNTKIFKEDHDKALETKATTLAMQGNWLELFNLQSTDSTYKALHCMRGTL